MFAPPVLLHPFLDPVARPEATSGSKRPVAAAVPLQCDDRRSFWAAGVSSFCSNLSVHPPTGRNRERGTQDQQGTEFCHCARPGERISAQTDMLGVGPLLLRKEEIGLKPGGVWGPRELFGFGFDTKGWPDRPELPSIAVLETIVESRAKTRLEAPT